MWEALMAIFAAVMGGITNAQNISAQREANAANIANSKEMLEIQQQYARENADRANEQSKEMYWQLMSPGAKLQQYKNAGLSPGLLYGGGASGGISTAQMAASPSAQVPTINPAIRNNYMDSIANAISTASQNELNKANKEKTEKEAKKTEYEIGEIIANTKKTEEEAKTEVVTRNFTKTQAELAENQLKITNATIQKQIELIDENLNLLKQNVNKTRQEIKGAMIDNQYKGKLYQSTLDLNSELSKKYIAETAKAVAEKTLTYAEKTLTEKKQLLTDKEIDELNEKIRQAKVIANEYDEFGYKITEANNWATELMSILRELKARTKDGDIIDLTKEFWGMTDEEYEEWLNSRK